MGTLTLKSENQILGDQITKFLAETAVNDINPGSVIRTLLEGNAQELFQLYVQLVNVVRNYNLDTTTGDDLDNRGAEYGVLRVLAQKATGTINIERPAGFTKVSTGIYSGFAAPSVGDTKLRVNDASNALFSTSGTLIVGRGTSNEENVTYSVAPVNNTNYWEFATSPFSNNHGADESVILLQDSDRTINAGTAIIVPAAGSTPQLQFTTDETVTTLAGEAEIDNVDVTCSVTGTIGNIPIKAIIGTSAFQSPPFAGAQAVNLVKFTTGKDREIDSDYRNRIKNALQSLSKATKLALLNAIIGLVDPTTAKRVVSSNIVLPIVTGDPVKIYLDDGSGFEASFSSKGFEQVITTANGGELRAKLDFEALVKAQVESVASMPFNMGTNGLTLSYTVGLTSETITFNLADFQFPATATAQELVTAINAKATLIQARTAGVGTKVVITSAVDTNEDMQVTGGTANSVLLFPTTKVSTTMLYRDDVLQSKDGSTASVVSGNPATYNFSGLGASPWPLNITIDQKSANPQVVSFVTGDFVNPAQATAAEVVTAINARLAGGTASVYINNKVLLASNNQLTSKSAVQVTGGSANSVLGFSTSLNLGSDKNYTLNRETGQVQFVTPLSKYDTITLGSKYTRAFLRAVNAESYSVTTGQTLVISVDGGGNQTYTFGSTTTLSAAQVAALLNASLVGLTASVRTIGGLNYLEITTNSYDQSFGSIRIQSSSTATAFGFVTATTVTNQRPHKAFVATQNTGPYTLLIGQTLVVVLDENPSTATFTITFGFGGIATSGSSGTVFAASALANQFTNNTDLPSYYLVWQTGTNTMSATNISTVSNTSGSTWRYAFAALPGSLSSMAIGDHAAFTSMQNAANNGAFLITGISTSGNGYIEVTNVNGVAEAGSSGHVLIGQRRQISSYTASTGSITVSSGFSHTPSASDTFALIPSTVNNLVNYLSNRKVSTLVSKATISAVNNDTEVQIASNSEGSDGTVQVTGGSANTVLSFSTTAVPGLAGYSYYTGLTSQVHKTIYGDDQDPVSFPGVGAAGVDFQILAPTVNLIQFIVTLSLAEGVSVSSVQDQVKSAISGYVNGLGVGDEVVLSEIIAAILAVDNILDVSISSPSANIVIASNQLARTSDAYITVG